MDKPQNERLRATLELVHEWKTASVEEKAFYRRELNLHLEKLIAGQALTTDDALHYLLAGPYKEWLKHERRKGMA